jgi:recombination protein RecT
MAEQQALTTKTKAQDIHALLDRQDVQAELRKALPTGDISPQRLIRIATTAILKSPKLKECTPLSLLACVVETAQLGFDPDPVLGEVYFVPIKGQANLWIGYQGFAKLAFQTGDIYSISSQVVRKGERFHVHYGAHREIEHFPMTHGEEKEGDATWTGAYAVAAFRDGHTDFEWLERADVLKRRARSHAWRQGKTDSPWYTDMEAMWKKTAIRALAKRLPKSTTDKRLARAAAIDELGEAGMLTPTMTGFEIAETAQSINDDPAEVPIQQAKEVQQQQGKKSAGGGKKSKLQSRQSTVPAAGSSVIPKAQIPRDPIDVKATEVRTEKAKADPTVTPAQYAEIYQRGTDSGSWNVDSIRAWVKKKYGCQVKELRVSQLPEVLRVMESGE